MYTFKKPRRPVSRVFIHCSASDNPAHDNVATMDHWHRQRGWSGVGYHLFIRKDGSLEEGRSLEKTPAAQAGHNRGTIAICLHGLSLKKFTRTQFVTLQSLCRQINDAYGEDITFHGHNEVAAKACPVFDYGSILKLKRGKLGDIPVAMIKVADHGNLADLEGPETKDYRGRPVLTKGCEGPMVVWLQQELKRLGYHGGAIDGDFGNITRNAVLAFQADNHLVEDGIVGNGTYEALEAATPQAVNVVRASRGMLDLAGDGSRIAQASVANTGMGALLTGGGAIAAIEQSTGIVTILNSSLGVFGDTLQKLGPWIGILVLVAGVYVTWQALKSGRARVEDHRTGKTL